LGTLIRSFSSGQSNLNRFASLGMGVMRD